MPSLNRAQEQKLATARRRATYTQKALTEVSARFALAADAAPGDLVTVFDALAVLISESAEDHRTRGHCAACRSGEDCDDLRRLAEASKQLRERGMTTHPELYAFRSWLEVQDYAQDDAGRDLKAAVDLIDEHGADTLIGYLDQLAPESSADVVISTAHKAKGREWNRVRIGDDFRPPKKDDDGGPGEPSPTEAMLAYVAVTRAKTALHRGSLEWIDQYIPTGDA